MIELRNAHHRYNFSTDILLPDLTANRGEHLLIIGLSGSGKSTLLHILAGLLRPSEGLLKVNGTEIYNLSESARDKFRGKNIGIIFQQMHLIDSLTVLENIKIAQYMAGEPSDIPKVKKICGQLEIGDKLHNYVDQLSEGQRQRVCIARAVVNDPVLILADEPTSSLDDKRADSVVKLLFEQASEHNATLIISTHDSRVKGHFENVINLDKQEAAGLRA